MNTKQWLFACVLVGGVMLLSVGCKSRGGCADGSCGTTSGYAPAYSGSQSYESMPSYDSPQYQSAPPSYSQPQYQSAPSYSQPQYQSAPQYQTPQTYSAPSYSAPAGSGTRAPISGGSGSR